MLHALLVLFLILNMQQNVGGKNIPSPSPVTPKNDVVKAVMLDQKMVDAEVKRLELDQKKQEMAELEKQKSMHQKLEQMKKAQVEEQKKLEKVKEDLAKSKKDMAALDDQRQAEQERVKEMRSERLKEEKKREQIAKQQTDAKRKAEEAKQSALKAATENQAKVESEVERILNLWGEKIRSNKREAFGMAADLYCKLAITVLPDGSVQVQLLQSSGNPAYDDLSMKAVYKSQPFQLPEEPSVREQVRAFEVGLRNDENTG